MYLLILLIFHSEGENSVPIRFFFLLFPLMTAGPFSLWLDSCGCFTGIILIEFTFSDTCQPFINKFNRTSLLRGFVDVIYLRSFLPFWKMCTSLSCNNLCENELYHYVSMKYVLEAEICKALSLPATKTHIQIPTDT